MKKGENVRMIYGLLTTLKKYALALFYKWKKKNEKIDFYSCKEILIRSNYCKLLLNQRVYVICDRYKFLCSRFSILTKFLNLIVSLKDWQLLFSGWTCSWKEKIPVIHVIARLINNTFAFIYNALQQLCLLEYDQFFN